MTQQPLTDQQLDDIEARASSEHLTPGPWDLAYEACDCGGDYPCGHGPYVTGVITPVPTSIAADRCKRTGEEPRDYDFHRGEIGDFTEADWALMVAAREDVAALLAEIRRQRAEAHLVAIEQVQQIFAAELSDERALILLDALIVLRSKLPCTCARSQGLHETGCRRYVPGHELLSPARRLARAREELHRPAAVETDGTPA